MSDFFVENAQGDLMGAPGPQRLASRGSRAEMERHFRQLPGHIRSELSTGKLRLADMVVYSIKPINAKTIKMFETQDTKETGLRNISNAKLPKNHSSGLIRVRPPAMLPVRK